MQASSVSNFLVYIFKYLFGSFDHAGSAILVVTVVVVVVVKVTRTSKNDLMESIEFNHFKANNLVLIEPFNILKTHPLA